MMLFVNKQEAFLCAQKNFVKLDKKSFVNRII